MVMRLTRELIHQAGTRKGSGWNKAQLLLLGVPWPPRYGWLRRLEGKEINDLVWTKVLELRGAKPKESRFQEQKLLDGIATENHK